KNRTNLSNDAQLISAFLTRDAQAAGGTDPQTGVADPTLGVTSGAFATATGCTAPPGNAVLGLKWIDRSSGTTYAANYSYIDPATADATYQDQRFLRTICSVPAGGAPDSATSVLANNVVSSTSGSLSVPKGWCDSNR